MTTPRHPRLFDMQAMFDADETAELNASGVHTYLAELAHTREAATLELATYVLFADCDHHLTLPAEQATIVWAHTENAATVIITSKIAFDAEGRPWILAGKYIEGDTAQLDVPVTDLTGIIPVWWAPPIPAPAACYDLARDVVDSPDFDPRSGNLPTAGELADLGHGIVATNTSGGMSPDIEAVSSPDGSLILTNDRLITVYTERYDMNDGDQ